MALYHAVELFVEESCAKHGTPGDLSHARLTVEWIRKLKPDASDALLIAGISHDIERVFNGDWKKGTDNPEALKKHQDMSAEIVRAFLSEHGMDKTRTGEVVSLISHHEDGGPGDAAVLCDADSLAYMEERGIRNVQRSLENGESSISAIKRLNYVVSRLSTPEAKAFAKPWHDEAIRIVNERE
ncbi:MAG TPA: HD domain-containing protein [Candidatus Fimivivens sp.]|nr:HD domain-containing protein [Candidatus Fimivivens sp.]